MAKNIEKLAEFGEYTIEWNLRTSLNHLKEALNNTKYMSEPHPDLAILVESFNTQVKNFKKNYGVEFPEIQEQYNKILPEIKKYIEVKD